MNKKEELREAKIFQRSIKELGYSSISDFMEIFCAYTASVTNKDELAQKFIHSATEQMQGHCGYIMSELGHVDSLKEKNKELNKEAGTIIIENPKIDLSKLKK